MGLGSLIANLEKRIQALEMRCYYKLVNISYLIYIVSEEIGKQIRDVIGFPDYLLTMIKNPKRRWYNLLTIVKKRKHRRYAALTMVKKRNVGGTPSLPWSRNVM